MLEKIGWKQNRYFFNEVIMNFSEKISNVKNNVIDFSNRNKNKFVQKINEIKNSINHGKNKNDINDQETTLTNVEQKLDENNWQKTKLVFDKIVKKIKPEDIKKININKLEMMKKGPIKEIWPKIEALFQMVKDPQIAWKSKTIAIATLIYLISPFDAIPDVIPFAGLADDAALIIAVVSTFRYELENYLVKQAEKQAEIEIKKYNKIVRISLIGSIAAAILAIIVKLILTKI